MMYRRTLLALIPAALVAQDGQTFRGKLTIGDRPTLEANGKTLALHGDDDTMGVLHDKRLSGADFEVQGKLNGETVEINPIHTAALFAYKDGKRLRITYWCDICAIAMYELKECECCQGPIELRRRKTE